MHAPPREEAGRTRRRFPKSARLVSRRDFERVRQEGERPVRDAVLKIGWRRRDDDGPPRLGLAVGRRLGKAPRRNRIKRVLREAFRLAPERFPRGLDLVVIPMRPEAASDFATVAASLDALAEKIRRRPRTEDPPAAEPEGGTS